jgi:hypothetical protein
MFEDAQNSPFISGFLHPQIAVEIPWASAIVLILPYPFSLNLLGRSFVFVDIPTSAQS